MKLRYSMLVDRGQKKAMTPDLEYQNKNNIFFFPKEEISNASVF
jgi:hypothetical protein